jgi:hypothetical protein
MSIADSSYILEVFQQLLRGEDVLKRLKQDVATETRLRSNQLNRELGFVHIVSGNIDQCPCGSNLEDVICATGGQDRILEDLIRFIKYGECYHVQLGACSSVTGKASIRLIHVAAALGNVDLLKFLSEHSCGLDAETGVYRMRPFHIAIIRGQAKIVQYLLSPAVDIDANALCIRPERDNKGRHLKSYTPLMLAIKQEQPRIVRRIINSGQADVNLGSIFDQGRPMTVAFQQGMAWVIQNLIWAGAHCRLTDLRAAMHLERNVDVLDAMLAPGGVEQSFDKRTWLSELSRCLTLAIEWCDFTLIKLLMRRGAKVSRRYAMQSLVPLVLNNRVDILEFIITCGCSISNECEPWQGTDCSGYSLRELAVSLRLPDMVKLIEANCERIRHTSRTVSQKPPLYIAIVQFAGTGIRANFPQILRQIHADGHDVNTRGGLCQTTALHEAVGIVEPYDVTYDGEVLARRPLEIVQTLIDLGADVDARDKEGRTVLWTAIAKLPKKPPADAIDFIKELLLENPILETGGRLKAKDCTDAFPFTDLQDNVCIDTYVTPLLIAVLLQSEDLVNLLLAAGYSIRNENVALLPTKPIFRAIVEIVNHHMQTPCRLTQSCRLALRRTLTGQRIHRVMKTIEYPESLKMFVLFTEWST